MSTLQLIPAEVADLGTKNALLPALRAGLDSSGAVLGDPERSPKRRRAHTRLRITDMGLRPFRVY